MKGKNDPHVEKSKEQNETVTFPLTFIKGNIINRIKSTPEILCHLPLRHSATTLFYTHNVTDRYFNRKEVLFHRKFRPTQIFPNVLRLNISFEIL